MIFQSTLRRTERQSILSPCSAVSIFQSTLRRTERLASNPKSTATRYFNPRSDERSDDTQLQVVMIPQISIHAPTNGATMPPLPNTLSHLYFNPRSDERSDPVLYPSSSTLLQFQSTLRRTKRLVPCDFTLTVASISIHAPTNGATTPFTLAKIFIRYFNPRSDERSDGYPTSSGDDTSDFNPRSDERSDFTPAVTTLSNVYFNPRSDERSDTLRCHNSL